MSPIRTGVILILIALVAAATLLPSRAADLFRSEPVDQPRRVVAADFNADGIPDLAILNTTSDQVSILLGDGAGGFRPSLASPVLTGDRPVALVARQLDGIGGDDLIVVQNRSLTMNIYTSQPTMDLPADVEFLLDSTFLLGVNPAAVVLDHFDTDGEVDAAVTLAGQDEVSILMGLAAGNFTVEAVFPTTDDPAFQATAGSETIVSGDWNQDGSVDLAIANTREGRIALLLGNNDRTFQAPVFVDSCAGCAIPVAMAVANFDADADPDLAVAFGGGLCAGGNNAGEVCSSDIDCPVGTCPRTDRIAVFPGDPMQADFFGAPLLLTFAAGDGLAAVEAIDVDGDAVPDLVAVAADAGTVSVFRNDGTGSFPAVPDTVFPDAAAPPINPRAIDQPIGVAALDAIGNGAPDDLAVVHRGTDNFSLLRNQSVTPAVSFSVDTPLATPGHTEPTALVAGDFFFLGSGDLVGLWDGAGGPRGFFLNENGSRRLRHLPAFGENRCNGGSNPGDPCEGDINCPGGGTCVVTLSTAAFGVTEYGTAVAGDFDGNSFTDLAVAARDDSGTPVPGVQVLQRLVGPDADGNLQVFLEVDAFYPTGAPGGEKPRVVVAAEVNARDNDFDGIPDLSDNCPTVFNPLPGPAVEQVDTDGDGLGDACEDGANPDPCGGGGTADCDADGLANSVDNCPAVNNPTQDDFDLDGIGDACEREGVLDLVALSDTDGDQQMEVQVLLGRGDGTFLPAADDPGCAPAATACFAADPADAAVTELNAQDVDQDGVLDLFDNCPTVPNPTQDNLLPNGICDNSLTCCTVDSDCGVGTCVAQFRGDDCSACSDTDGDGEDDILDNCPLQPNPAQNDTDFDGIGDLCEIQGADLLVGAATMGAGTGFVMFSGDNLGGFHFPRDVPVTSTGALPGNISLLAVGVATGVTEPIVAAVENTTTPEEIRLLLSLADGTLRQTDLLDLSVSSVLDPPVSAASYEELQLIDLNADNSDDIVLVESTTRICAAGTAGDGSRCDVDGDCGGAVGSCLANGSVVVVMVTQSLTCIGGVNDGLACVDNADCPGGICGGPRMFLAPGAPYFAGVAPAAIGPIQFDDDNLDTVVSTTDDLDLLTLHHAPPAAGSGNLLVLVNLLQGRADLNDSGRVDGFDLSRLARNFGLVYDRFTDQFCSDDDLPCLSDGDCGAGATCTLPATDLNLDGQVEGMDLAILTILFGRNF